MVLIQRPSAVKISDCNSNSGSDKAISSHNGFLQLATELDSTVEKSLKLVPDSIRGALANIFHDVIQTASSMPMFTELLLLLSKMQLTNVSQSSHEPTGNPVGMSCETPSLFNSNTDDEPKVSHDLHNQLPTVLPQTNFVSPSPGNIQKLHEVEHSKQHLGFITHAPVIFDQNMSKEEQKEGFEIHRDGMSVVSAKLPFMPSTTRGGNNTLGSFDKPNLNNAPMLLHGNRSTNVLPCDATARHPFESMFSFKQQGCSTYHVDVLGNRPFASPTAFPSHSPMLHPYRRSANFLDSMPRPFHRGIICDSCRMHPIVGPRYKSTVLENYNLCCACFRDMDNEAEYTRIDWSTFHFSKQYGCQLPSEFASHNRVAHLPKLDSCFIRDVIVWDGTVISPCSRFTKIWKMCNNGTIFWPFGTQIVRVRGDYLEPHDSVKLKVDDHQSPYSAFLNLSLSPKSSEQNNKVIVDVDVEPLDSNKLSAEVLNPMGPDMLNSTWLDVTSVYESLPPVSYPVIDIPSFTNPSDVTY